MNNKMFIYGIEQSAHTFSLEISKNESNLKVKDLFFPVPQIAVTNVKQMQFFDPLKLQSSIIDQLYRHIAICSYKIT